MYIAEASSWSLGQLAETRTPPVQIKYTTSSITSRRRFAVSVSIRTLNPESNRFIKGGYVASLNRGPSLYVWILIYIDGNGGIKIFLMVRDL